MAEKSARREIRVDIYESREFLSRRRLSLSIGLFIGEALSALPLTVPLFHYFIPLAVYFIKSPRSKEGLALCLPVEKQWNVDVVESSNASRTSLHLYFPLLRLLSSIFACFNRRR